MNKRVEELIDAMKAFNKETYNKQELLPEMFKLQEEMVKLTFAREHAENAELRIWDVENHLIKMNEDNGYVADDMIRRFCEMSKIFSNLIKAEISGNRGEMKAFRALGYIKPENTILKNIELNDGISRTELDAVVVTSKSITIVEVKNTRKDVFIDHEGNYFTLGKYQRLDCNIADKMNMKEALLRKILVENGFNDISINKVVVFTDNRIEIHNEHREIRTCFVSQLAYIVDSYELNGNNDYPMENIVSIINEAKCSNAYVFDFDVKQYKLLFAKIMDLLERTASEELETKNEDTTERLNKKSMIRDYLESKSARSIGKVVASIVAMIVVKNTLDKGGV